MRRILRTKMSRRASSRFAIGCATISVLMLGQGSLLVPQALAAAAPTATTGASTQVQFASATVTGTVNPNGSATTYYFEYGTTASYGTQTSTSSAGAGTTAAAVQQALSGLAPSTTYHYRLVAVSVGGTVDGHDATFATTKTPAPAATTSPATGVTNAAATLHGSANAEGVPTTYYFEYGTTGGYGSKTTTQSAGSGTATQAVAADITGLAASTTYHYRLVTASAGGTVVGGDVTFATAKTPAPLVTTLAATKVGTTTAVVNASVNPEGIATTYHFQYGTTSGYGRTTATHSAGSGTTAAAVGASLSGLVLGTTYHYRVVAVSAGGTVDGRDATFATVGAPAATTGAASAVSTTTASLAGSINPHGVATSYYFLYGTKSLTTRTPTGSAGAGTSTIAVSASLSKLTPGTTYVYRLVAVGAGTTNGATRSFTTAKIAPGLSLTSRANPVLAGARVTLDGTLSGTGVGVRTVALQIEPYPYTSGFTQVGPTELTNAAGRFSFTLASLSVNTRVRAVTVGGLPPLVSAVILERAVVRVSVHLRRHRSSGRFFGQIAPGGAPVQILIQRRFRGRWVTIVRTTDHPISGGRAAYSRTIVHLHHVRYRVIARVRDQSLVSGRSRVVAVH